MRSLWPIVAHQEIPPVWRERQTPEPIFVSLDLHALRATRLPALAGIERSFVVRLDADEQATARFGPVNRPARRDVEFLASLPQDLDDLRLGGVAHIEQRDGVAF